ncbi:SWIM zinc finger family protein [Bifidobacterium parmae]|uniref:Zinc finger, SWIM domain-containing protein n=1 Tax=Bifidobacterium parmae TaxID=361854 RepID=A0A2N5J313_9BIFI|nr:SWIM zinc finger family protein [Bifidobacterium parmae]PLS28588.1 zinc finger, SWIM domain-containing protein [Bifidobacterium parmae]
MRHLDGFYELFDPKVYDRGHAYYDAGKVDHPVEISEGLWHAVVRGSEDYQVDVRLRHGKVVSAACTCPYGQRVTYCKHVAGVLISLDESLRREDSLDSFPREASFCVDWYLMKEFPTRKKLKELDWRTVRILLERLCNPQDLDGMLFHEGIRLSRAQSEMIDEDAVSNDARSRDERHRAQTRARRNEYEPRTRTLFEEYEDGYRKKERGNRFRKDPLANIRLLVPGLMPTRLNELPHVWLTILEAAYEHLHDEKGLRHLYAYYILIAQTDPEAVYVERLRRISGRHWNEDRDMITALHRKRDRMPRWAPVNPAYERLLREERLPDEAFNYALTKSPDVMIRMLDVIAGDSEKAQWAEQYLRNTLLDPDSVLYESDTVESAARVGRWIRRSETVYGYDEARALVAGILDMFPRRKKLHDELSEYLSGEQDGEQGRESMSSDEGDDDGKR